MELITYPRSRPHPVTPTTKGVAAVFGPQNTLGAGAIAPAAPPLSGPVHHVHPVSKLNQYTSPTNLIDEAPLVRVLPHASQAIQ